MYICLGYLLTFSNSSGKIGGEFYFCGIYRVLSLCLMSLWSKVEYLVGLSYVFLSNPCLLLQRLFPSGGQRVLCFFVLLDKNYCVGFPGHDFNLM